MRPLSSTFCNDMDCSTSGLPVHHQLPGLAEAHVHWVSDAFKPAHPLVSPSPPAFNLSQPQGLFQWVSSSYQVAKVLKFQHQSFQWILDWFPLGWTGWIFLQPKGLSRVFCNTTIQKHQFFHCQLSLYSPILTSIHGYWKKPQLWLDGLLLAK